MTCEACQTPNPEGNHFCGNCGNPLALLCPNCGHSNPPGTKFCGQCGTALDAIATPVEAKTPAAERRLVSVLFADLTGYTSYAEGRDAEDVRAFLSDYFDRSREVIERFGGIVEKFIGDAVMAVWGAETATEDDAELAVRAGLELVEIVDKLSSDAGVPELALRVGVHTGEAAVGPTDDRMGFVTGDLVNTASRLETAAEPGTVLVGESTHLAASRSIAFEAVGPQSLKGKSLPVEAWRALRVVSERGGVGRTETLEPPFVGRTNELRLLKDMLESVGRESRSRLISLVGEAGIGKSRLVWEFLKYIDGFAEDIYWHEGRSPSYGEGVTFWAVAEMIKGRAGIVDDDSDEVALERLDEALTTYVSDQSDRDWIRPRLLAVLGAGEAPPGDRSELDAAVRAFFEGVSELGTTVLVFEDLHWADTAVIDFVDELTDWWRNKPILIVTMARTDLIDRRPGWGAARQGVVSLTLGPLSDREMTDVVTGTVPGLPDEAVDTIVQRSAGIPLYAVELLRGLIAQGSLELKDGEYHILDDVTDMAVPESLQAVIGARLDRLDPEDRALIQDAAVLGHAFSISGLSALTGRDPADLEQHLHALSRRELIEPVRDPRSSERGQYRFLQEMIRDVALGRLSRDTRRERHLAAAQHFEAQDEPELAVIVASHYMQALDSSPESAERDQIRSKALESLQAAAGRAADMRAYEQVLSISNDALAIADSVPTDVTDFAKATFWEQMVEAASNEARVEDIERYGTMAVDHYRASGDERSTWRAMNKLALALSNNHRPDRAIEILRNLVEDSPDLAADPELARAATIYSRALMLSGGKGVRRMTDTALDATERLQLVPEIVDGLITKATVLGMLGRIVESRVLLEGAIGIAEPRELSEAVGRAKNNLAYVLIGIDNAAGVQIGESLFQDAKRLGNRSQVLFQGVSRVAVLQYQGRFEDAEEILTDPLFDDPPPAIRAQQVALAGQVARWRGNHEEADALKAEALELAKGVDDPQALANLHVLHMDMAMQNDLDKVIELGLSEMSQDWFRAFNSLELTLMAIGLSKDLDQLDVWIETMRPYLPRLEREVRFAEALSRQARGVDSVEEIDAMIDEVEEEGWLILVIQRRISAAAFLPEGKAAEYLDQVRDTCSDRGWNWYPELVDRYLS